MIPVRFRGRLAPLDSSDMVLPRMPLNERQKRHLRALAHQRKPVVIVGGAGVSDPVIAEIDIALAHHELIKVRVNAADREGRAGLIEDILQRTGSELVQRIGHVAVLYRRSDKSVIALP